MSWKFIITCFILLVIGLAGLEIIDQRIVSVNTKISNLEKQVFIDNFQNNFISYLKNLEVNFTIIKSLEPEQINEKWLTEFATSYASLHPSFDSIYLINNKEIKHSFSSNYKHLIKQLSFEQMAKISSNIDKTLQENNVLVSKPLNFFDDEHEYILYFIPVKSKDNNTILIALFNLQKLIDNNIRFVKSFEDSIFNIKTSTNKHIYGSNFDDLSGERVIIEGFESPLGVWNFEIQAKNSNQFNYLRQLIWILGFALLVFLVFYMLIVERKNFAITKNYLSVIETKSQLKVQYEIEQILRKIIEKVHSSDNIHDALEFICTEISEFLELDHAGVLEVGKKATFFVEYRSKNVKNGMVGKELSKTSELYDFFISKKQEFISSNVIQDTNPIAALIRNLKIFKVKSAIVLPVIYNDQILAILTFATINKFKEWTNDEIKLLRFAVDQVAIALYQRNITDELDLSARKINENILQEQCLKQIITKIRTCLNVHEVVDYVCNEIAQFLKVDRVIILEYSDEQIEILPIKTEYKSNEGLVSFKLDQHLLDQLNMFSKDLPDSLINKQLAYSQAKRFFFDELNASIFDYIDEKFISKSFVTTPISTQKKVFGQLFVSQEFFNRTWESSELEFLAKVAEQIAMAMYQSRLYDELKNFSDKQVVINRIFEVIRSSINIDEILWNACYEIGSYLDVDHCSIIEYNADEKTTLPVKYEYLSNRGIRSGLGLVMNADPEDTYAFHCVVNEKRPFVLDDVLGEDKFDKSSQLMQELALNEVKSFLLLPIIYADKVLAFISLAHYKDKRRWNESDIYFLKSLANQIAIAIHQAMLFRELNQANKKLLELFKKEQTVRRIFELVRSSLDLDIIYPDLTEEIGKILQVNRCYFIEYDRENNTFLKPRHEYRSSDKVLSMIGYNFSEGQMRLGQRILNNTRKPFIIDSIDDFIVSGINLKSLVDRGAKSMIIVPVVNQEEPLGLFLAVQTEYQRVWKQEEIELLQEITGHLAIAIAQINMYLYVQEMNKMKSEFLASVSHELKTPLNSILVLSELMQKKDAVKSFEEQVELLNVIHSSGEELLKHINNILDMAKVEFTKKKNNLQEFNLHKLIDEIRVVIKPLVDEKSVKLIINIDEGVDEKFYSDRELFKFILNNLMNNAIKFTHRGYIALGISKLSSKEACNLNNEINPDLFEEYLYVSVKDTGIGIDEVYFSLIFDEFRQVEDAEVRNYSGTGLGLSICKKSVNILQGKIWVESVQGQGSEFKVLIPVIF